MNIDIRLDETELRTICRYLAADLNDETPGADRPEQDDFPSILDRWHRYAPSYITEAIAHDWSSENAASILHQLNETADVLGRLVAQLPSQPALANKERREFTECQVIACHSLILNGEPSFEISLRGSFTGRVYHLGIADHLAWREGNIVDVILQGKALKSGAVVAVVEDVELSTQRELLAIAESFVDGAKRSALRRRIRQWRSSRSHQPSHAALLAARR